MKTPRSMKVVTDSYYGPQVTKHVRRWRDSELKFGMSGIKNIYHHTTFIKGIKQYWYLHRHCKPALMYGDTVEWYAYGLPYQRTSDYCDALRLDDLTKMMFVIKYGDTLPDHLNDEMI